MARLLVFDSNAQQDAGGNALKDYDGGDLPGSLEGPGITSKTFKTQAVRLYGSLDGPLTEVLYEFLFEGAPIVAADAWIDLSWWQEFYSDKPTRGLPSSRLAPGVNVNFGWARETLGYVEGAAAAASDLVRTRIEVYEPIRHIVLADGYHYFASSAALNHAFIVPCPVWGLYGRLVFSFGASGTWPETNSYRFRVWAVAGGQDQQDANESGTLPYVPEV